ncbi:phosphate/sulfate permease [Oikeobacillus pervagus]|uniref:Phosphate/sulfate permease n=1 Tax=Oikeobacillus pervagus TaxID=1325931 RepID=A0AAJ1T3X6_9BACI|nr:DUF6526 family protein [Oikeobacillus pervagus]MDQ0216292.1 phosphate/sulfate permease [Oikeobacillus pervagus]
MKQQSYENHTRYHPLQHFIWLPLSLVTLISSIIYAGIAIKNGKFSLNVFLILALVVLSIIAGMLARMNALTVQNRLIRVEEQFRHYVLTNEPIDPRLTLPQLIALRFASDEEFPALAKKAAQNKMNPDEIKKAITYWRADEHRV